MGEQAPNKWRENPWVIMMNIDNTAWGQGVLRNFIFDLRIIM